MCLAGSVLAVWSVALEMTGSSTFNDKKFCHGIRRIQQKHLGKNPMMHKKLLNITELVMNRTQFNISDKSTRALKIFFQFLYFFQAETLTSQFGFVLFSAHTDILCHQLVDSGKNSNERRI